MGQWQLQEAKAKLSEVIQRARKEGPQQVTVRGKPAAIIVSAEEYEAMKRRRPRFVELVRSSPLVGMELDIERDRSPARDADL